MVTEAKYEAPVEVAYSTQRPVVDIGLLKVVTLQPPMERVTLCNQESTTADQQY
jgi:hypothetical protein